MRSAAPVNQKILYAIERYADVAGGGSADMLACISLNPKRYVLSPTFRGANDMCSIPHAVHQFVEVH